MHTALLPDERRRIVTPVTKYRTGFFPLDRDESFTGCVPLRPSTFRQKLPHVVAPVVVLPSIAPQRISHRIPLSDESLSFIPALDFITDAANHVARDSFVDLFGVREVEVGHDGHEFFDGLGETGVVRLLFAHGAAVSTLNRTKNRYRKRHTHDGVDVLGASAARVKQSTSGYSSLLVTTSKVQLR